MKPGIFLESDPEQFERFLYNVQIAIYMIDDDALIMYANRAGNELLDYGENELLGQSILSFFEDQDVAAEIFSRFKNSGKVKEYPAGLISNNGLQKNISISSTPHLVDGKLAYTEIFITDVTELSRVERKLTESETRFNFMSDTMPQQIWTATPAGTLDYVNQRIVNDFGASAEEIIGTGWVKFLHPEDVKKCLDRWSASLTTGQPYEIEFRLNIKNAGFKWHLGRAQPLMSNGTPVKWFGTNTDIDEQKKNEEKKDEFISIASHELKTPLTNIKAFIQLAVRNNASASQVADFLGKADQHISNLQRLIADLLDTSKINAGKISYDFAKFNFAEALNESIESVRHQAPAHQLIIENNAGVLYKGDKFRIEQVINNFLTNAIKYSPDADKIIIKADVQEDNIVVSVQDFGIGIAREHLARLFDRFYRVDNTAMKYEGLGLGLYISSEILKRHGGSFWIESEPGVGSTFYFLLPLKEKADNEEETDHQTFYKSRYIDVRYNPGFQHLDVDWTGFQSVESVKAGGWIMLDLLQKNNCSKVLNDNTHVKGNWSEASDWAGNTWFPMMEKAGLKFFAWVYSPSTFSTLAAEKSVDIMIGTVQTQFFTSKEEAHEWLKLCK